jgi:hypothetical protein
VYRAPSEHTGAQVEYTLPLFGHWPSINIPDFVMNAWSMELGPK